MLGRSALLLKVLRRSPVELGRLPAAAAQVRHYGIIDKVKGAMGMPTDELPKDLSLDGYADQLKTAKRMSGIASMMPASLTGMNDANPGMLLGRQEEIARALGREEKATGPFTHESVQRVVVEMGSSVTEVREVLRNYDIYKAAVAKMAKLKAEGKPTPNTQAEYQQFMAAMKPPAGAGSAGGATGPTSRNAQCPCGSRKLYKRCCGQ